MARRHLNPYTVLILGTGKNPIMLTLRPIPLLVGLLALVGIPILWIGALTYHNSQLERRNQTLTETAAEVLTELDALDTEIKTLKNRAGLSDRDSRRRESRNPAARPQGGVAAKAEPEGLLEVARQQLPTLGSSLADVKPALEATLEQEATQAAALPEGKPIAGRIEVSSEFGLRRNPFGGRNYELHEGIDFAGPVGRPILATGDGVVVTATYDRGYGNYVKIDHGYGYETLYAHLSKLEVATGDPIKRGDVVGALGSTGRSSGPHLHYSIYRQGKAINPRQYLKLPDSPRSTN